MADLRPERPDVKPERSEWGGEGMDLWIDKQLDGGEGGMCNRSPKGNMWSAIPVALLCMIVN